MVAFRDVPPGQVVIVRDKIGDNGEFREVVYCREEDGPTRHAYNVPVTRLRTMQGHTGQKPRYDSGPIACRDPGEADGRTSTLHGSASFWVGLVVDAVLASGPQS